MKRSMRTLFLSLLLLAPAFLKAQSLRVLTNQVGYEDSKAKHAVVMADRKLTLPAFYLIDDSTGRIVYHGKLVFSGPVDHWKNWQFWTIDFSPYTTPGVYR